MVHVCNLISSHYSGSFVEQLAAAFNQGLAEAGHTHTDLDLYKMNFDPVMKGSDFNQFTGGETPVEIEELQNLINSHQVITCFYPVWWNGMPAILKGFIDRVFAKGFAYDYGEKGQWGLLKHQKALLFSTLGNSKTSCAPGLEEAMRLIEKVGLFGYCGIKEVEHYFFYSGGPSKDEMVEQVRRLGREL